MGTHAKQTTIVRMLGVVLAAVMSMAYATPVQAAGVLDLLGCDGLLTVIVQRTPLCTHGNDAQFAAAPTQGGAGTSLPSLPPRCIGTGSDGRRTQVLAVSVGGPFAATTADLRRWVGQVEWTIAASAERNGGERGVRWVTEPDGEGCRAAVLPVALSRAQVADFGSMMTALADLGHTRSDRKYLAFVDVDVDICGIATVMQDDDRTDNASDQYAGYARVDRRCWASGDDGGGSVAAHELVHTLGAVQNAAPNSTGNGHCSDEWDLMCYDDGGGTVATCVDDDAETTAHDDRNQSLLDCNGDDYFNAGTPSGWLARHWNVADSKFLAAPGVPTLRDVTGATTQGVVESPILGPQGPTTPSGHGWDPCLQTIDVIVADGPPTRSSSGGVLGLGGSSTTEPSASALRDAVVRTVSWVNGAVGRPLLAVEPDGIEADDVRVDRPAPGTLVVSPTADTAAGTTPTRVRIDDGREHVAAASILIDTDRASSRIDTWLAQAVAQGLGLGRGGAANSLMAPWPVANPSRSVAEDLLAFLLDGDDCTEERQVVDTASGHASQRRSGTRVRTELATGATDPVSAAVSTSRWLRETQGEGWADVVVLCRADVHADCLAGSGLASDDGPVLFVPGGPSGRLPDAVRDEVVASAANGATVHILGGSGAVSVEVEHAVRQAVGVGRRVLRLSGADRFATATRIADEIARRHGPADVVVLARADDPVDAVAAGAWAADQHAPVLLTRPNDLPAATSTWLASASRPRIVVVGGTRAVAAATLDAAARAAGSSAVRVSGPDRFATALALSTSPHAWGIDRVDRDRGFVAVEARHRHAWAFALAAAPVAAHLDAPLIWVERDGVPAAVAAHLRTLQITATGPTISTVTVGRGELLAAGTAEAFHTGLAPGFDGNVELN